MLPSSGVIYRYEWDNHREEYTGDRHRTQPASTPTSLIIPFQGLTFKGSQNLRNIGIGLLVFALGGMAGPLVNGLRLEAKYAQLKRTYAQVDRKATELQKLPPAVPVAFAPLATPDGASIDPVNREFSLVVPKVGINAAIVGSVDPSSQESYSETLKKGISHASTSLLPDQDGTVFLFSHSTNYDWFVRDLNAVFYLLKNVQAGDSVVVFYKGKQYNYRITGKKVVTANDATYLYPVLGKKQLILQTCWPPGSTAERLLIFADLVIDNGVRI